MVLDTKFPKYAARSMQKKDTAVNSFSDKYHNNPSEPKIPTNCPYNVSQASRPRNAISFPTFKFISSPVAGYIARFSWVFYLQIFINLVGTVNASSPQSIHLGRHEGHAEPNVFLLLPSLLAFNLLSWWTIRSGRSSLARTVLFTLDICAVLTIFPALQEIGWGNLVLGAASSLLLGLKALAICGHPYPLRSGSLPLNVYGRCPHCSDANCNGDCGQGGSSGGSDLAV